MKILVVEDTRKHLDDARQYSQQLVGCEVDFATNLAEALQALDTKQYDGVVSDVFFPAKEGASPETCENAISLSKRLVEKGVHHVFNTSGNHHGRKYKDFVWATPVAVHNDDRYHFLTTGMIIEAYPKDSNADKDEKQWQAAFRYILLVHTLLQQPDKGAEIITTCELDGFPYGEYGKLTKRFQERASESDFLRQVFEQYNA